MKHKELKAGAAVIATIIVIAVLNSMTKEVNKDQAEELLPAIAPYVEMKVKDLPPLMLEEYDNTPLPEIEPYDEPLLDLISEAKEELPPLQGDVT
tara:strand:- start:8169 stop:8453 length:285 start_codon:yes stop_codon:yes gene_type:complete